MTVDYITRNKIYAILRAYNPNIVLGSVYPGVSFISKILSIPNISICDTDHAWLTINATYPFSNLFVTGKNYKGNYGS